MNEELQHRAAIYIEESGVSGDAMIERDTAEDGGSFYLHDIMAGFATAELAALRARVGELESENRFLSGVIAGMENTDNEELGFYRRQFPSAAKNYAAALAKGAK